MNDRHKALQPGAEHTDNRAHERTEQFNELSELSLEERMNVADQLGVPIDNMNDAVATGTMQDNDETPASNNPMDEESTSEETDR